MPMIEQMARCRRDAAKSHCRIKEWRLTDDQAWSLAGEIVSMQFMPFEFLTLLESIKRGDTFVLGARVTVQ